MFLLVRFADISYFTFDCGHQHKENGGEAGNRECSRTLNSDHFEIRIVYLRINMVKTMLTKKLEEITRNYKKLQEITRNYKKLQEITRNYKKLQEITRNYKKLQEITRNYKKLQGITRNYKKLQEIT